MGCLLGSEQSILLHGAEHADDDNPPAGVAKAAAMQERLCEWADKELPLRIQQAERSAVCCGDGVYTLAWEPAKDTPAAPTSEQIKVSAQARLDASLLEGRKVQQVILQQGKTPSDDLCQAVWDRKTPAEQHGHADAQWMHGCADKPAVDGARAEQHHAGPPGYRRSSRRASSPATVATAAIACARVHVKCSVVSESSCCAPLNSW